MSKLGVKKLIVCALVAISAIACFAGIGLIANNNQKVDNGQPVFDIGLKYKDGWYLIEDADDYYTMCDNTSIGATPGAKYKLVNDIAIDPRKANNASFIDATLDGNGHKIINDFDPSYQPDINAGASLIYPNGHLGFSFEDIVSKEHDPGKWLTYAAYISATPDNSENDHINYDQKSYDYGATPYAGDKGVIGSVGNQIKLKANGDSSPGFDFIGGLFGYADSATVANVYLEYKSSVLIEAQTSNTLTGRKHFRVGGLIGYMEGGEILNCIVKYNAKENTSNPFYQSDHLYDTNGYITAISHHKHGSSVVDDLVGVAYGITIENCLIIKPNVATAQYKYCGADTAYVGDSISEITNTYIISEANSKKVNVLESLEPFSTYELNPQSCFLGNIATTEEELEEFWDGVGNADRMDDYLKAPYQWTILEDWYGGNIVQSCLCWSNSYAGGGGGGTEQTVTITADANGGIIPPSDGWTLVGTGATATKTVAKGDVLGVLPAEPTREGYDFAYWQTEDEGFVWPAVFEEDGWIVTGNTTIVAVWDVKTEIKVTAIAVNCSFTLPSNDVGWTWVQESTVAQSRSLEDGYSLTSSLLPKVNAPAPTGCSFEGWYTSATGGSKITFPLTINESRTIYARYKANKAYILTLTNLKYATLTSYETYLTDELKFTKVDEGDVKTEKDVDKKIYATSLDSIMIRYTLFTSFRLPGNNDVSKGVWRGLCTLMSNKQAWILQQYDNSSWITNPEGYGSYNDSTKSYNAGAFISGKWGNAELKANWHKCGVGFDWGGGSNKTYKATGCLEWTTFGAGIGKGLQGAFYNINSVFKLPTKDQVEPPSVGANLIGWKVINEQAFRVHNWGDIGTLLDPGSTIKDKYGDVNLQAVWCYEITLTADFGKLPGLGNYGGDGLEYDRKSDTSAVVRYETGTDNMYGKFDLPGLSDTTGAIFQGWQVVSEDGKINWIKNAEDYISSFTADSYGNATLKAFLECTRYTITINFGASDAVLNWSHVYDVGEYDASSGTFKVKSKTDTYTNQKGNISFIYYRTNSFNMYNPDTIQLPGIAHLIRPDYDLTGFTPNGAGNWGTSSINPGSTLNNKYGDVTLTAQWKVKSYTITLNPNGGTLSGYSVSGAGLSFSGNVITYLASSPTFDLPDSTNMNKTAYNFSGWKILGSDPGTIDWVGGTYKTGVNTGSKGNVVLIADWRAIKYAITFDLQGDYTNLKGLQFAPKLTNYRLVASGPYNIDNGTSFKVDNVYSIENTVTFPTATELTRLGFKLEGFTPDGVGNWGSSLITSESVSGKYGDVKITVKWEPISYTFTLNLTGETAGGNATLKNYEVLEETYNETGGSVPITYDVTSEFNLPTRYQILFAGYTAMQWELISASADSNWGTLGSMFAQGAEVKEHIGNVVLEPVWTENTYNIKLHSNNGGNKSTDITGIKYTNQVQLTNTADGTGAGQRKVVVSGNQDMSIPLDWELSRNGHILIGWATEKTSADTSNMYDTEFFTYEYIQANRILTDLNEVFGTKILQDGNKVSKITEGSYEGGIVVDIYAIWLPIYDFTIEANIPNIDAEGSVNGLYYNATKIPADQTGVSPYHKLTNNYLKEYKLYAQDEEIFNKPNDVNGGYKLFYYGHTITSWTIKMGGNKYYVDGDKWNPSASDWKIGDDSARVKSETNMQYLQGNIVATPQWETITFDVRFKTDSNEGYKAGYREDDLDDIISSVTFEDAYIMSTDSGLITNRTEITARDISGYCPLYTHPYLENGNIDEDTTIDLMGVWNYILEYKKYSGAMASPNGNDWYIEIEGYYSPNLYRLELNLDLPYTEENDFKLNNNDFTVVDSVAITDLKMMYKSKILEGDAASGEYEYVNNTNYLDRQNNIYKVGDKYYIYLLQDQIIKEQQLFNQYENGKAIVDTTGTFLPTFEIAYYQMQYYYTFNGLKVNLYQMAELDEDHISQAKEKLKIENGIKDEDITANMDWKYSYCHTNGSEGASNFALNVYWYRNVVDLHVNNLLKDVETFSGYTLIEEIEQVTTREGLQGHNKYHLVIYKEYETDVFGYVVYGFDDFNKIKQDLENGIYNYSKFTGVTGDIVDATGPIIPIYFGNTFVVQAVDQSKDSSEEVFIGYRFDKYEYAIQNKSGEDKTIPTVSELDSYVNDGTNYTVTIDLKKYEHDETDNPDNYFEDKDKLILDVIFDEIKYKFIYQVTDVNDAHTSDYGNIELRQDGNLVDYDTRIEHLVTISSCRNLFAQMNVRLGSELIEWAFVIDENVMVLTELLDPAQSCQIEITASFLRTYIYADGNYSSEAEQDAGNVNARCKDIEFKIKVNLYDISTEKVIKDYALDAGVTNTVFTINDGEGNNTYTVSIGNVYNLIMLTKQTGDPCVLYHLDGKRYVIRELYIKCSLSHSTNQLVTEFAYPLQSLDDISMLVDNKLLDYTINYAPGMEVFAGDAEKESERFLNFYVEIAPTYEITFEINQNANDKNNGSRQISISDVIIAKGEDKSPLAVESDTYLGYWGQEALIKFNADSTYYSSVKLKFNYTIQVDREFSIEANSNAKYSFIDNAKVTIELIPKIFSFNIYIDYQGTHYNIKNNAGANGERPISELTTAIGTNIFDDENNFENAVTAVSTVTDGKYRTDDVIKISYKLNPAIASDFEVAVKNNGNTVVYNNAESAYIVRFSDKDIVVVIEVKPKPEKVILTTNMESKVVADIYAQVNDGEAILVHGDTKVNPVKEIELISGDSLTVYVKDKVGFTFENTYSHGAGPIDVTVSDGTGEFEGYVQFKIFEDGFELTDNGTYTLNFKQIPIDIQFKYYTYIPTVEEEASAGSGYLATSQDAIIEKGSEVTLTQGNDSLGYRFDGYTYGAVKGEAESKEFDLIELNQVQQRFTITEEVLEYLEEVEVEDEKISLVVYVNYVKQYTYKIEYECEVTEVSVKVINNDTNENMAQNKYYDYGTPLNISVKSVDTKHYQVDVELEKAGSSETINTETIDTVEVVEGSKIQTNLGNLSGFTAVRGLTDNYVIRVDLVVEKYDTKLTQYLNKGSVEEQSAKLEEKGEDLFKLVNNVYYKVTSTYEYGSVVKVDIYVVKPQDRAQQYYALEEVKLNGRTVTAVLTGESEVEGKASYVYTIEYELEGDDLPIEQALDVYFNAIYHVAMNVN